MCTRVAAMVWCSAIYCQIPYRSRATVGAQNVLVAGRFLVADEGAFGAIRVMVGCAAAGLAARLALDSNQPLTQLDAEKLRTLLAGQGSFVL